MACTRASSRQLFERYRSRLRIRPVPIRLSKAPREFVFDTLVVSAGLVDPMLAADREAIGSGEVYDRAYYDRFFAKARPTLERRLSEAIAATAAVITHAWEEGGKPSLADVPPPGTPAPAADAVGVRGSAACAGLRDAVRAFDTTTSS